MPYFGNALIQVPFSTGTHSITFRLPLAFANAHLHQPAFCRTCGARLENIYPNHIQHRNAFDNLTLATGVRQPTPARGGFLLLP